MFTGIVEATGTVANLQQNNSNLDITIRAPFSDELKIDQSVAHNGVCLTITSIDLAAQSYTVTAIKETLDKSNIGDLKEGGLVNLERCMQMNGRLDGHIVQGHVDQTGTCTNIENQNGSYRFSFCYDPSKNNITVEKGSICVNGVSLTVVDSKKDSFSVAIIPYTFEHTNFKEIKMGDKVNLEFDIIGKYVARLLQFGTGLK
jgi:riboflavin synthase